MSERCNILFPGEPIFEICVVFPHIVPAFQWLIFAPNRHWETKSLHTDRHKADQGLSTDSEREFPEIGYEEILKKYYRGIKRDSLS